MNKWVECAMVLISSRYSNPPYEYRFETPEIAVPAYRINGTNGQKAVRPDVSVYREEKLIAVFEIGDLSRRDKLQILEETLPDVAVWWIPKTDLIIAVDPEMHRYRFISEARILVGEKLLAQLMKERMELSGLTKLNREGVKVLKEMMHGFKATMEKFQLVEQEIDITLERATSAFRLSEEEISRFLSQDGVSTNEDRVRLKVDSPDQGLLPVPPLPAEVPPPLVAYTAP